MSTNFLDEIGSGRQHVVFQTGELALLEKMRVRSKLAADRDQMAKELEFADETILRDLQDMGFDRKTVGMLHLVPLIQVAWSEGTVTSLELKKIIEIAQTDERLSKTQLEQLVDWVNNRPSDEFFVKALRIIRLIMEGLSDAEKAESKRDLIAYCTAVAHASQRLPASESRLSAIEEDQIADIAKAIGKPRV